MHDMFKIAEFMDLGGQKVPDDVDKDITKGEIMAFLDRTSEELDEIEEASNFFTDDDNDIDFPGVVDGFIDAAYVALTGAIRVAGLAKAKQCWDAVVEANDNKINGTLGDIVRDEGTGKILKPEGWVAPDIKGILDA